MRCVAMQFNLWISTIYVNVQNVFTNRINLDQTPRNDADVCIKLRNIIKMQMKFILRPLWKMVTDEIQE